MFKVGNDYYIFTEEHCEKVVRETDNLWEDEGDIIPFIDTLFEKTNFDRLIRSYRVLPETRGILDGYIYIDQYIRRLSVNGSIGEWGEWYEMPDGKYYFWIIHEDNETGYTSYYRANSKEEMIKMLLGED